MNVGDAAYATVHDYPGGSESLAPRLGTTGAVLRNKVNPQNDRNVLSLGEADAMMGLSKDYRILQALAAEHGFGLVALDADGERDSVMGQILQLGVAEGELARAIRDALADDVISANEASTIASNGMAMQKVLIRLLSRLQPPARSE